MNIAAVPAANTASGSANNQAQTASALGEAGSKALAGFLVNVSDYYKEQRRQKLTDAYSAGLNGVDLSRKTRKKKNTNCANPADCSYHGNF